MLKQRRRMHVVRYNNGAKQSCAKLALAGGYSNFMVDDAGGGFAAKAPRWPCIRHPRQACPMEGGRPRARGITHGFL